jgi:hypothetical protein
MHHPRADATARQDFETKIAAYEAQGLPILYQDESGFAHDAPRAYGYASKGKICAGIHNWHAKGCINALGAIIHNALLTLSMVNCNINADIFHTWVTQDLLPKCPEKTVIVMDNATFHKRADTQKAIREAGHILLYLPPYSPDLNPIEHFWAKAKAIRRQTLCSPEQLFQIESFYVA